MIEEAYVSFETAKLLREKGFKEPTLAYTYGQDMTAYYSQPRVTDDYKVEAGRYPLPTLQMAMRWLREVHNIGIFPSTYTITNSKGSKEEHVYGSAIVNLITFDLMCDDIMPRNSYEEACEAAIKYCFENLI